MSTEQIIKPTSKPSKLVLKRREVQVHMAVTIMGDPFNPVEAERRDVEIAQFAFAIPPKFYGSIKRQTIVNGSIKLTEACLNKMRLAGLLKGGE